MRQLANYGGRVASRRVPQLYVRALHPGDAVGGNQPQVRRMVAIGGMQRVPRIGKNGRVKPEPARPQPSQRRHS